MQVEFVRGDYNLRARHRECIAAFGGFDGLHLGHRAVIGRALELARASAAVPAAVVLFEPLPREFLDAQGAPPRLYPLRERVAIIAALGVERVVCLRFNARIAASGAGEFIERILVGKLGVRALVVGEGFRFGRGKAGDVALLNAAAARYGFVTECVSAVAAGDERISSTGVREALTSGDLSRAARLLGRDYSVSGRVGHGSKRGAQLGFPTANLMLGRRPPPLRGVFAVAVEGAAAGLLPGVANAGYRPTFGGEKFCLEVHLPGFSANLYGRRLRVRLLARIRDEQRFDSVDELKSRIKQDVEAAMGLTALSPYFSQQRV